MTLNKQKSSFYAMEVLFMLWERVCDAIFKCCYYPDDPDLLSFSISKQTVTISLEFCKKMGDFQIRNLQEQSFLSFFGLFYTFQISKMFLDLPHIFCSILVLFVNLEDRIKSHQIRKMKNFSRRKIIWQKSGKSLFHWWSLIWQKIGEYVRSTRAVPVVFDLMKKWWKCPINSWREMGPAEKTEKTGKKSISK